MNEFHSLETKHKNTGPKKKTKLNISDDFGLRSLVMFKKKKSTEKGHLYRSKTRYLPHVEICYPLAIGKTRTLGFQNHDPTRTRHPAPVAVRLDFFCLGGKEALNNVLSMRTNDESGSNLYHFGALVTCRIRTCYQDLKHFGRRPRFRGRHPDVLGKRTNDESGGATFITLGPLYQQCLVRSCYKDLKQFG